MKLIIQTLTKRKKHDIQKFKFYKFSLSYFLQFQYPLFKSRVRNSFMQYELQAFGISKIAHCYQILLRKTQNSDAVKHDG